MTAYAALAPRLVVDISTACTVLRRDCPLRAGALNCWTADEVPSGSANRVDWQGIRIPVCEPPVPACRHRPGTCAVSWSRLTRSSALTDTGMRRLLLGASDSADPGPRRSAARRWRGRLEGRLHALRVGDRRAAEHQRSHGGDGSDGGVRTAPGGPGAPDDGDARPRTSATCSRNGSNSGRMPVVGTSAASRTARSQLQPPLGVMQGEPDLAGHLGHRHVGQLGEQQHLALAQRSFASASRVARMSGRACGRGGRCAPSAAAGRAARPAAGPTLLGSRGGRPCASGARRPRRRRGPRRGRPAGPR